jgi:hypothetical protein
MQKPEIGIKRDVRWKIAEPLDDFATYIVVIQLGIRHDEEASLLIKHCDKAGGFTGPSNGKDYALIHVTASWMYLGAITSASFFTSNLNAASVLFFNM